MLIQVQNHHSVQVELMHHQEACSVCPVQKDLIAHLQGLQYTFLVSMALIQTVWIKQAVRAVQLARSVQIQPSRQRTAPAGPTVWVDKQIVWCVLKVIGEYQYIVTIGNIQYSHRGTGMAHWRECLPLTNVIWIQFCPGAIWRLSLLFTHSEGFSLSTTVLLPCKNHHLQIPIWPG